MQEIIAKTPFILAYSIVVAIAFISIALLLLGKNKAGKGDALADPTTVQVAMACGSCGSGDR